MTNIMFYPYKKYNRPTFWCGRLYFRRDTASSQLMDLFYKEKWRGDMLWLFLLSLVLLLRDTKHDSRRIVKIL